MADPAARPTYRRARREAEKADRKRAILDAADELLAEGGYESFSMVNLAKKVGIAKGTLYLYFETREDVLLALYLELRDRWAEDFDSGLREGMTDKEFIEHYLQTALANLAHLELRMRLRAINYNASTERLRESRRVMREGYEARAPLVERAIGLEPGEGILVLVALRALLIGSSELYEDPAPEGVEGPAEDTAFFENYFSRSKLFRISAPLVLAGVRARHA